MSKELIKVFGYKQNLCSGQNFESSSCAFIKYFFMFFIKHWQLLNKREKIKLYVKISFLMILLDISTLAYSTIKTLQNSFLFRAIDMRYNWISTTAVAEHILLWTSSSRMKYDILIVRIAIKSTIRKGRKENCGIFKKMIPKERPWDVLFPFFRLDNLLWPGTNAAKLFYAATHSSIILSKGLGKFALNHLDKWAD